MRDILMAYGNEILEATMSQRARWFEFLAYKPLLEQYFKEDPNFLWEAAPKPRLSDESYVPGYWEDFHGTWSESELMEKMHCLEFQLTEKEPLFDTADDGHFIRVGQSGGNKAVGTRAQASDATSNVLYNRITLAMSVSETDPQYFAVVAFSVLRHH